jgi:hypothetical protein
MMTDDNTNAQANPPAPASTPALQNLGLLVGTWDVELVFPTDPPGRVHAAAVFDWLDGQAFVIEHWGGSTWIIGFDDTTETYSVLYHDERGVSRVYQMSLSNGLWKLWRNTPDFSQCFEGQLSADGQTITARWEKSTNGSSWEQDFALTYSKVR